MWIGRFLAGRLPSHRTRTVQSDGVLSCGNVIHKARQEPEFPHADPRAEEQGFSRLTWATGFLTTLLIPLVILLVSHGVLHIPLRDSKGTVIFLFFIWVSPPKPS